MLGVGEASGDAVLNEVWSGVSAWVEERRSVGDRPEDVLALLGLALAHHADATETEDGGGQGGAQASGEHAMWAQVALLAAEQRRRFAPRKRLRNLPVSAPAAGASLVPSTSDVPSVRDMVRGARKVLLITGADASSSAGFPCFPADVAPLEFAAGDAPPNGQPPRVAPNFFSAVAARHGLFHPADLFEMHQFIADPTPLYDLVREYVKADYQPTVTHAFVAELERRGMLLHSYNLNIDGLQARAGATRVTDVYGSLDSASCAICREPSPLATALLTSDDVRCAVCSHELNRVRPALTFAGTPPAHALEESLRRHLPQADLLIVIGPVAGCGPVATVAASLARDVPQIYLGETATPGPHEFDVRLIGPVHESVRWLTEQLGWGAAGCAEAAVPGVSDMAHIVPPNTVFFGPPPPPGPAEVASGCGAAADDLCTGEQPPAHEQRTGAGVATAVTAPIRVQTPLALPVVEDGRKRRSG